MTFDFRRFARTTATASTKMFATRNDLSPEFRAKLIDVLNQQLAGVFDFFSQAKQTHWNVKGAQFFPLHELFEKLAVELAVYADDIAGRATALGVLAASMRQAIATAEDHGDVETQDQFTEVYTRAGQGAVVAGSASAN